MGKAIPTKKVLKPPVTSSLIDSIVSLRGIEYCQLPFEIYKLRG